MPVYPADLSRHFSVADLIGQFILCTSERYIPPGWSVHERGARLLAVHPVLPVVDIVSAGGDWAGWLIGYPISPDGRMITENIVFDSDPGAEDGIERLQSWLYLFGGRYAALLVSNETERFYLDPMGSLSCVYSPAHEIVCSTPGLIPYTHGCGDNRDLIDAMGVPETTSFFIFGLTPRYGVERLLPNHYLDLSAWIARRHWLPPSTDTDRDTQTAAARITQLLKRNIEAVALIRPVYFSLTAGCESRVLLACARDILDRATFFTFDLGGDKKARLDCRIGAHIASRFGLDHVILRYQETPERDQMEWLWRSGCCISEPRGRRALKTYRALDAHRAELPGVGGEAGRSTYWWAGDTAKGRIDLEVMIRRKAVSTPPEVLRRGRMWLDALPADNMLHIIDVMYIEQRLGCWGGVLPYADPVSTAFRVYPYCHREIIDRSLCLPSDYRFRGHFPRDIVEREWPELLEVPFNEPVGWRRLLTKAGKNLKRAQKLLLHPVQTAAQIRERSRRF